MTPTLNLTISISSLLHMLWLALAGFILSMAITPLYTTAAYRFQWWKKQRTDAWSGGEATVYNKLHAAKHKRHIPNMAGLIFVPAIALITIGLNWNRGQTWLPLVAMLGAGLIGLIDDVMNIRGTSKIAGMKATVKFGLYSAVVVAAGWWFYEKLGTHAVFVPGLNEVQLGIGVIALFWFVVIATANSVNITDGLDGLAGGLLVVSFLAYAVIAVMEHKFALAGFCMTIVGALLSYTWFNIYPARFFMGDIGSFALGTALGVVAMQTDTIYVLPIIGFVYVMETGSVIINRTSRKLRGGKKVFLSSPIHHHFEAIGWPETKVTMRFWVLGGMMALLGLWAFVAGGNF